MMNYVVWSTNIRFHLDRLCFRNGRWRSTWTATLSDDGRSAEVVGVLKVQVGANRLIQFFLLINLVVSIFELSPSRARA